MPEQPIAILTEQDARRRIVDTLRRAKPGTAPFALVLGAGFSRGLVPTAQELVEDSLPLWVKALNENRPYSELRQWPAEERRQTAREFWKRFVAENSLNDRLPLDPASGLPQATAEAYKAVFSPAYSGAVGAPAEAREFQRALMRLDEPRLNAPHFLLASLLGVQPGKARTSDSFKARAAFSRLILTTNFDPFLQTALQAVNRLYFMTDTPELGVGDEIFDDDTDAVHLVYLHGSIHRRSQAATETSIRELKRKNAEILKPVLKRHGVIVLGYSGWDDAVVEALAACDDYDHRLYWCGLEPTPDAPGVFGPRVPEILRRDSAFYVRIDGAGRFLAGLCNELLPGLPRLLENPIAQLREMLQRIDLKELDTTPATGTGTAAAQPVLASTQPTGAFVEAKNNMVARLQAAETAFRGPIQSAPSTSEQPGIPSPTALGGTTIDTTAEIQRALASARATAALGNAEEALKLCYDALSLPGIVPMQRAELLAAMAQTMESQGRHSDALVLTAEALGLPGLPIAQRADLLVAHGRSAYYLGRLDDAIRDWTQVISLPGVPVDAQAHAYYNRGVAFGQQRRTDLELADYTTVIEGLPNAPDRHLAKALCNRGFTHMMAGQNDLAQADFDRIVEKLPGALDEDIGRALANRGWLKYVRQDYAGFLADTDAALKRWPRLGFAAFNLGLALLANQRDQEALEAYRRAGTGFRSFIDRLGLDDLAEAQSTWLAKSRAEPIVALLESLRK